MGLFDFLNTNREDDTEIRTRLLNSEAMGVFVNSFCNMMSRESENYNWILADPKRRWISIDVYTNAVVLQKLDRNNKVDEEVYGFNATGYADLPNRKYAGIFNEILTNAIQRSNDALEVRGMNNGNGIGSGGGSGYFINIDKALKAW